MADTMSPSPDWREEGWTPTHADYGLRARICRLRRTHLPSRAKREYQTAGIRGRTQTSDSVVNSHLLFQLSYPDTYSVSKELFPQ